MCPKFGVIIVGDLVSSSTNTVPCQETFYAEDYWY